MRLVIVESPFMGKGDTAEEREVALARNLRYLRACMHDCIMRNEAPFASHALYTQPGVLDDADHDQRTLGIRAGFSWRYVAAATVVYTDLGTSSGMRLGIDAAESVRMSNAAINDPPHVIEYRTLGASWEADARIREEAYGTVWPMLNVDAAHPCGWDEPTAQRHEVLFEGELIAPEDADGLALGLVRAGRKARGYL